LPDAVSERFPLDAEGRCALCRAGLRGFDAAYCFGAYEGVLRQLIHIYKYGKVKTLARPLADLLARALPRDERFRRRAPVPLHWRRRWQRGFNQSELLARRVSAALRHSRARACCARSLYRGAGEPQQHRAAARTWPAAFACRQPERAAGRASC
jgi:predicted amidophosphoribosyltransferase